MGAEDISEGVERTGDEGEVRPHPAFIAGQQTGVDQHLQVMGHGWLGQSEGFCEVADAGLAAVAVADHAEQTQAHKQPITHKA